eukprot:COSAG01_NODE_10263_length_2207_cov_1.634725_1_plen_36_part_10
MQPPGGRVGKTKVVMLRSSVLRSESNSEIFYLETLM